MSRWSLACCNIFLAWATRDSFSLVHIQLSSPGHAWGRCIQICTQRSYSVIIKWSIQLLTVKCSSTLVACECVLVPRITTVGVTVWRTFWLCDQVLTSVWRSFSWSKVFISVYLLDYLDGWTPVSIRTCYNDKPLVHPLTKHIIRHGLFRSTIMILVLRLPHKPVIQP
jgi:hypothetical protein